jgi:site-specific DNA-methyltransferase (adenine-specific)
MSMRVETIGNATLYLGDCREVIPALAPCDALITDPPYGVALGIDKDMRADGHGLAKLGYSSYDDSYENLVGIVAPAIAEALKKVKRGAVFVGPHLSEMPKANAFGGIYCSAAVGRHAWGFNVFIPFLLYGKDPELNKGARLLVLQSSETSERNGHPCPKPIGWMNWLVARVTMAGESVFDPFMGSGTTGVACANLSRPFVGVEIDPAYFDIACERIAAAQAQQRLFT